MVEVIEDRIEILNFPYLIALILNSLFYYMGNCNSVLIALAFTIYYICLCGAIKSLQVWSGVPKLDPYPDTLLVTYYLQVTTFLHSVLLPILKIRKKSKYDYEL